MNLTEKENLTGVKNFNGFKQKFPILDVRWFQNSHLTLINEKKALVLSVKLALNTQLVFTCSNAGIETLEQVVKNVQSL